MRLKPRLLARVPAVAALKNMGIVEVSEFALVAVKYTDPSCTTMLCGIRHHSVPDAVAEGVASIATQQIPKDSKRLQRLAQVIAIKVLSFGCSNNRCSTRIREDVNAGPQHVQQSIENQQDRQPGSAVNLR